MLKSLFESSIDKLHIPADMKDAIKQINNICLEAEGDDKEKDLGYTPLGEEDKKKADQIKADQERKEKAEKDKQKEMEANGQEPENPPTWNNKDYDYNIKIPGYDPNSKPEEKKTSNQQAENVPTSIDDAETDDDIWKVLKNLQQKAVANKGTAEGEKWRQKLEDEYWKATNDKDFKRVKGFELTINNPEYKKAKTDDKAAETKPAEQPAQATGEQPAKNAETKTAEQPAQTTGAQPAQNAEGQQAQTANGQPAQNAEGQQVQAADGKAAEQPAAAQTPTARRGADVATVQYFLQSALPNSNVVADGILGPKTITAIQQKEDIDTTGKMDKNTQDAFNKLLAEAKKKVIPIQEKLGVTADGLIGKQTLQAMAKQNMNVTNVFSENVKGEKYVAAKKADVNVLDTPFDKAKADKELANRQITSLEYRTWRDYGISPEHQRKNPNEADAQVARLAKEQKQKQKTLDLLDTPFNEERANQMLAKNSITKEEYNTWKGFGISPEHQRQNPKETKQECIRLGHLTPTERQQEVQERLARNNPNTKTPKPAVGVGNDKNVAEVAASVTGPKNDAEKKFFNQTKENWTKVYAEKFKNAPDRVEPAAEQQARIELMKYRARMAQAARKNGQQQAANQGNTQQAQQQAQKQPAPQGNQQQAATPQQNNPNNEVYHTTKDSKGTTEYYSGNISWGNLSPEEKKIKEDAEAKEQAKYYDGNQVKKNPKTGKPYDEQIVLHRIQSAGQNAVIKNRMAKARERQAASGKQG